VLRSSLFLALPEVIPASLMGHNAPEVFMAYGHPKQVFEATAALPEPITLLQRTEHFERFA